MCGSTAEGFREQSSNAFHRLHDFRDISCGHPIQPQSALRWSTRFSFCLRNEKVHVDPFSLKLMVGEPAASS